MQTPKFLEFLSGKAAFERRFKILFCDGSRAKFRQIMPKKHVGEENSQNVP